MNFEEIYHFFSNPPVTQLSHQQAVCYTLSVLLSGESYGTELIERLISEYPNYRLSDTVLYSALKFLEAEGAITGYWKKLERRGRPRRMYRINPHCRNEAQKLARLWAANAARDLALSKPVLSETGIVPQAAAY